MATVMGTPEFAIITLVSLAVIIGLVLAIADSFFKVAGNPLIDQVDNILPQTQCGQCGYPGCKPYATAMIEEDVAINRCPPGGQETINQLAQLLGVDAIPLDEEHGVEQEQKMVAVIIEDICIGCTKCIQACPVDAILGAAKQMHTVIADECTGCDLCVDPCPVDCIEMVPIAKKLSDWRWDMPSKEHNIIASTKQKHNVQY